MDTTSPKSNLVDAIKKSTNILVTVSNSPSVDALSAALGLSLMLNKLDKHATAVFSGAVPHAIEFLEPGKRFEDSVSSLRDFIVALDKDKADRLRYKVEGDLVRIYITPYKTTITEKDLQFSEGDFNVDLVVALGVEQQDHLDTAITAHGKILHDATVATINTSSQKAQLGTINWYDDKASSLCEMLMGLSEALQTNVLDEQISTALLTGIVAATERFSNEHTTPRVMTMSAQLMAAGANQQLIAEKLEEDKVVEVVEPQPDMVDGSTKLEEGESQTVVQDREAPAVPPVVEETVDAGAPSGEIHVYHDGTPVEEATKDAEQMAETAYDERRDEANADLEEALHQAETTTDEVSEESAAVADAINTSDWRDQPATESARLQESNDDEEAELPQVAAPFTTTAEENDAVDEVPSPFPPMPEVAQRAEPIDSPFPESPVVEQQLPTGEPPVMEAPRTDHELPDNLGFKNDQDRAKASSDEDELSVDDVSSRGKTLDPVTMQPIKSSTPLPEHPEIPSEPAQAIAPPVFNPLPAAPDDNFGMQFEESPFPVATVPSTQAIDDLKAEVVAAASTTPTTSSIDDARSAVNSAFGTQPLSVGGQPEPLQSAMPSSELAPPPPPPMPDFSAMPPMPPMPPTEPVVPGSPHPAAPAESQPQQTPLAPAPNQFRIPGQ